MMRKKNLIIFKFDMTTETEDINLVVRSGYPIRHRLKKLRLKSKGGIKLGEEANKECNSLDHSFYKEGDHWTLKKDRHGYYCEKDKWADHIDGDNVKLGCCLGSLNDIQVCAPDWVVGHSSCADTIQEYCAVGDNIVSEGICRNFCGHSDNKQWCDQAMRSYCQKPEHRGLEICSCIVSSTPNPGYFDPVCMTKGYLTANHLNDLDHWDQVCQQLMDCYKTGTCDVDLSSFERACPSMTLPQRQVSQRRTLQSHSRGSYTWLIGVAIVAAMIIAVIIIVIAIRPRKY